MVLKESIIKLRKEGKTYDEIVGILGCAKSTVSFHVGDGQKEKHKIRKKEWASKENGLIRIKLSVFLNRKPYPNVKLKRGSGKLSPHDLFRNKVKQFKSRMKNLKGKHKVNNIKIDFNYKSVMKKIGSNPTCYLTGKPINLKRGEMYNFDHIKPVSKGGTNDLSNLGLSTANANAAKSDMSVKKFIILCREVLEHNGFKVTKKK
jgi:hypothetical protein